MTKKLTRYNGFDGCDCKVSWRTNVVAILVDESQKIRKVVEKEKEEEIGNWYQLNIQYQEKKRRMMVHAKEKDVSD